MQRLHYTNEWEAVVEVGVVVGSRTGRAQLSALNIRGSQANSAGMCMRIAVGDEVSVVYAPERRAYIVAIYASIEFNQKLR